MPPEPDGLALDDRVPETLRRFLDELLARRPAAPVRARGSLQSRERLLEPADGPAQGAGAFPPDLVLDGGEGGLTPLQWNLAEDPHPS